jgi:cysteinyl-tRNA synthetase
VPADLAAAERLALLRECDAVLALDLLPDATSATLSDAPPSPAAVAALVEQRAAARQRRDYARADALREQIQAAGWQVSDTHAGPIARPIPDDAGLLVISAPHEVADQQQAPDRHAFSVNLLSHCSRADLERCVNSVVARAGQVDLEIVILDNGSTDDTLPYLRALARVGGLDRPAAGPPVPVRVIFADHDLGFAAGRRATTRASSGRTLVWLDTSMEVAGDIWSVLEEALADPEVGLVGAYGLVTDDLREFRIAAGPDVDAVEGYLMAFRRARVAEVGTIDDRYRFYRLADIALSFQFKTAGYRVLALAALPPLLVQHPHREWGLLTPEERQTKSKKNYDRFRERWHHGQSLLTANHDAAARWFGHDHPLHLGPVHQQHTDDEWPTPDELHVHEHQHWADHSHSHAHAHSRVAGAAERSAGPRDPARDAAVSQPGNPA